MEPLDLPDDLKDDVEIIYLNDDEIIEDMHDDEMEEDDDENETVQDMAKVTFTKHSNSIFCGDMTKDGLLAVTGGQDDMAYVWKVDDGTILLECTGHKDSVSEVGFNHDNQLVVTADMGGLTQVWSLKDKKLIWCNEGDDMLWLFWHHSTNVILTGSKAGEVYIWQVPQGNCKVLPSPGTGACTAKLLNDGKRIIVGYEAGILKLWDIKNTTALWQLDKPLYSEIVCIGLSDDNTLVSVGPNGYTYKVADGKFVTNLQVSDAEDIEEIAYNSELNVVVTGSLSGHLCVRDLGRFVVRHEASLKKCITVMKWAKDGKIIVGTIAGTIYVCDIRTGTLVEVITGHVSDVLSITVSTCGKFMLTTSDDGCAKIFEIRN